MTKAKEIPMHNRNIILKVAYNRLGKESLKLYVYYPLNILLKKVNPIKTTAQITTAIMAAKVLNT